MMAIRKFQPAATGAGNVLSMLWPFLTPMAAALLLAGCVTGPQTGFIPTPLFESPAPTPDNITMTVAGGKQGGLAVQDTPAPPGAVRQSTVKPPPPRPDGAEAANLSLMVDQMPLPTFIQMVFGTVLKKNFSTDPAVSARTDLVTLRTGAPQSASQVLATATMLLKTYGIAVTEMGGFYRIAPDSNQSAYAPEIRRGRAQPEVPLPLRPVFNLVELTAVRTSDVSTALRAMFGNKLTIQDDPVRNALLLSGQASDITAALEAIQVLDQPLMRGRSSRLITPSSLSADELARKLIEVLAAEGYAATNNVATSLPISMIPIPASNSLLVFAVDPAVLEHVIAWARKLDTLDNDNRRSGGYFTYPVKYADAQDLAKTMQELLAAAPAPAVAAAPGAPAAAARPSGRIVVNSATNTLILTSNQGEYAQLLGVMRDLDKPARSALIEVTVAEVRVTAKNQLGIEWGLNPVSSGIGTVIGGTQGGLGIGTGGLTLNFLNSANQIKATLNALAYGNNASILSTPRVMARNGETATIQVGQEVPIVTSQQVPVNSGIIGNTPAIPQTVQYRNTGVILKVKPVIHAGNRVELEVSQEVSSAVETKTGVTSSPTFSSRKVETKLSIRDGATVLLGGLMSRDDSKGESGIPLLKDIPVAGQLFRTNTDNTDKTELIVLITPYVIDDDLVAEQVTQAFRSQLGPWAQPGPSVLPPKPKTVTVPPAGQNPAPPVTADTPTMPPALPAGNPNPLPAEQPLSAPAPASPPAPAVAPPSMQSAPITDPALLKELRDAAAGKAAPVKLAPKPVPKK